MSAMFGSNQHLYFHLHLCRSRSTLRQAKTIHAQENGRRGTHFAKSLNSNFLKGLTYSALHCFFSAKSCWPIHSCTLPNAEFAVIWSDSSSPQRPFNFALALNKFINIMIYNVRFHITVVHRQQALFVITPSECTLYRYLIDKKNFN